MQFKWSVGAVLVLSLCGVAFSQHLTLKQIAFEGTCTEVPGSLASNLNLTWITTIPKFYITYGSLQYWVQNAEACLGEDPMLLALLANMEQRTEWDLNSTTTCFGRSIFQQCALKPNNGNPYAECQVTHSDRFTKPSVFRGFKKRVVLTDNLTFALFVRCTAGLRSYYIVSPTPFISTQAITQSLSAVIQLGFNPALFTKFTAKEARCY